MSPKKFVYLLLVLSIISSLTVVSGLSFQKPYRPDLMLDKITEASELPLLVSTVYRQHSDIAKMMGLAWEMRRQKVGRDARFLLSDDKCDRAAEPHSNKLADCLGAERVLANNIKLLKQPLDVWVVNYPSLDLNLQNNCQVISPDRVKVQGFRAKLYRCLP